jgi:ABC-2 type transport system ATP-binding protein
LISGLWGRRARFARKEASSLLEEFGLDHAADRLIGTYSGGMRRRLDLAGALINEPRVLFLDEPTTGLDAQSRRAMWARIRALREEGAAIFLTTQYLEEADVLADRVAILKGGRVVAQGTPDELMHANGDATLRLKARDPSRVAGLLSGDGSRPDGRGWLSWDLESADVSLEMLMGLREQGVEIEAFSLDRPTIEDAFIRLTGEALGPAVALNGKSTKGARR